MRRLVVAVRHGNLPAGASGSGAAQGCHVLVIEVRVAPDFQVTIGIGDRLFVRDAKNADVGDGGEAAAQENAIGQRGVVVARQDHNGAPGIRQELCGALKDRRRDAVVIEGVAGE